MKFLQPACLFCKEPWKSSFKSGQCHVDSSRPTVFTFKEKCRTLAQNFWRHLPTIFCCVLFYSSSWRGIFLYVLARNVRTLPWRVLSYVFIFPSFLKSWADSPAEIGHPLLPACSRRAGGLLAGLWLRRGVDRLCFRPRCPQLSLSLGTWADITTQGPRCPLPPGPLFRTQAMPPNSWLAVMVGSAPLVERSPCPSVDGPREGRSGTAGTSPHVTSDSLGYSDRGTVHF